MRCERCGRELTNKIIKINGVTYCENCVKDLGLDKYIRDAASFLDTGLSPMDELASSILKANELDFGNSTLACPKCGTTLRQLENGGKLGCIECYNTFSDYIAREFIRRDGSDEYCGREPGGELIGLSIEGESLNAGPAIEKNDESAKPNAQEVGESKAKAPAADETKPEAKPAQAEDKLTRLAKADLGMLSDDELKEGIKLATEGEDYELAIRLRDELSGRKDGE